jgi:hypothetical protein
MGFFTVACGKSKHTKRWHEDIVFLKWRKPFVEEPASSSEHPSVFRRRRAHRLHFVQQRTISRSSLRA